MHRNTPKNRSCSCEVRQKDGGCEICADPKFGQALGPRERQVVMLYGQGLRTKEIAARLMKSPKTISTQLMHATQKLGLRDRVALRQWGDLEAARAILDAAPIDWARSGPNYEIEAMSRRAIIGETGLIFVSGTFTPEELQAMVVLARGNP